MHQGNHAPLGVFLCWSPGRLAVAHTCLRTVHACSVTGSALLWATIRETLAAHVVPMQPHHDELYGSKLNLVALHAQAYAAHFAGEDGRPHVSSNGRPPPDAPHLLGTTEEIENLRPRSP